jgi:hypothetical protein
MTVKNPKGFNSPLLADPEQARDEMLDGATGTDGTLGIGL